MRTVISIPDLRAAVRALKTHGKRIAFVPTMGNLHAGHLALVERARQAADAVVASIFVNPLQFGAGEDFERYPRTEARDAALLAEAGADLLFLPAIDTLYPHGKDDCTRVEVPALGDILCGAARPGHFVGVTTIVAKLFNLVQPDVAVFGEKDFQQLTLLRRMVLDLDMPIEIIGHPTRREDDGLAMSSRNGYLDADERARAPMIHAMLKSLAGQIHAGRDDFGALEEEGRAVLDAAGFRTDYVAIRRVEDLAPPQSKQDELVILAAAWLGRTRLIDNQRV
ncbi:MAG: pantoate--beta-alanine ligase [Halothiobacillaceae bacterium]|nr:MAG: pantoate--beta-alanine ligase [Halothiobacillaceae bacterium]